MDELRVGVIGSGMMGIEHLHNLNHVEGMVVTAVADTNDASRRAGIAVAPDATAFERHEQLIESGSCDAVVVSTPNMTHHRIVADLLSTDLHVLVEKPLGLTVAECRELADLDALRDAITWVGLEYRYMAPIARLLSEVDAGAVGSPTMVAIREHRFPFLSKVDDWNRFNENTGGTLVEKCCHFFDLMRLIIGAEPARVMASGGHDVNHLDELYDGRTPDILDNAFVIVDFENGSRAMLDLCMFAEATHDQEEISVVGPLGKVEARIPSDVVRVGTRGLHRIGNVSELRVDSTAPYDGLHGGSSYVEHLRFRDAIRSGSAPEVSVLDGLMSVAMGQAAQLSITEGRVIDMAEIVMGS